MTIDEQLHSLKREIEKLNIQKIEVATTLKNLDEDKKALLQECVTLGVDPSKLQETYEQEERELRAQMDQVTKELNNVARS